MIASKTWYLTADRSKAVPEGDKSAQFLLVRAGQEISEADVEKYSLNVETHAAPETHAKHGKK